MTMKIYLQLLTALSSLFFSSFLAHAQPTTAPSSDLGAGKVVGLDYFFNHQVKNGKQFHYIWEDTNNSGYSKFGDVWKQYGATLASLPTEPTWKDLAQYSIFIIVNPSTVKTAADHQPNFMTQADADLIA